MGAAAAAAGAGAGERGEGVTSLDSNKKQEEEAKQGIAGSADEEDIMKEQPPSSSIVSRQETGLVFTIEAEKGLSVEVRTSEGLCDFMSEVEAETDLTIV